MSKDKYYNIIIMNKGYGKTYHELQMIEKQHKKLNGKLRKENEKLNKDYMDLVNQLGKLTSRIYKAVEYINEHIRIDDEYPSYMEMLVEERDNLLNILQNGSEK